MHRMRYRHAAWLAALIACQFAHAGDVLFWNEFEESGCPAGRIIHSDILYYSWGTMPVAANVNMTEWSSLLGISHPGSPALPWPGQPSVSIVILDFIRDGYIAAHFNVTQPVTLTGSINHGTYLAGANLTMAISHWCGDFTHVENRCTREGGAGEVLGRWRTEQSAGQCTLEAGDYYLNLKLSDPDEQALGCTSVACEEGIQSIWNAF
jgi:hypothetical protein